MRKYFMGLLTHLTTTAVTTILVKILDKLIGIEILEPLSITLWIYFFFVIAIYISLGNFLYKNLSTSGKIISTVVVMSINTTMSIAIYVAPYNTAFIIKLIFVGFNNILEASSLPSSISGSCPA